jgi:hypothetical protein
MKRCLVSLLPLVAVFGCSGSQPGPGAEESSLRTEAAFCDAWAEAACSDRAVMACSSELDSCLENQAQACRALVPPGYKAKYAEECVEAVGDAYDDATLTTDELDVVLKLGGDCKRLVDGGQDEGGDCVESADCDGVNGFECVIQPGQTLGTCEIPVEVGAGRRCSTPGAVCEADFYCDGTNCVERLPEGEACDGDVCAAGFRCALATGAADTTCIPQLALRQPCTSDDECASGLCLGTTRRLCVDTVPLTFESSFCNDF